MESTYDKHVIIPSLDIVHVQAVILLQGNVGIISDSNVKESIALN